MSTLLCRLTSTIFSTLAPGTAAPGQEATTEAVTGEGIFRQDGLQRFRGANGFPSEAAARQWVNDQLAAEDR